MGNENRNLLIFISLFILVGVILFFNSKNAPISTPQTLASLVNLGSDIDFAGFNWDIIGEGSGTGNGRQTISSEGFIDISSSSSASRTTGGGMTACMVTSDNIQDIDEFLVILSGEGSANSIFDRGGSSTSRIGIYLYNKLGDRSFEELYGSGVQASAGTRPSNPSFDVDPQVTKVLNNFDGTYSAFSSLGVGDVFIKDKTIDVSSWESVHLAVCALSTASDETSASSSLRVYNIVTKEMEAPVCNAGEIPLPTGECENFESILLAHESALFESFEDKLLRIEERLLLKEKGLQDRIDELEAQLGDTSRIEELEKELQLTNKILENIQSGELNPPPDVDIEEIINKVLNKIDLGETIEGRDLTDEEIQKLIDEEVNEQFQKRLEGGVVEKVGNIPIIPIIVVIVIIAFLFIIFKKN